MAFVNKQTKKSDAVDQTLGLHDINCWHFFFAGGNRSALGVFFVRCGVLSATSSCSPGSLWDSESSGQLTYRTEKD